MFPAIAQSNEKAHVCRCASACPRKWPDGSRPKATKRSLRAGRGPIKCMADLSDMVEGLGTCGPLTKIYIIVTSRKEETAARENLKPRGGDVGAV